jgi:hypothetical protein
MSVKSDEPNKAWDAFDAVIEAACLEMDELLRAVENRSVPQSPEQTTPARLAAAPTISQSPQQVIATKPVTGGETLAAALARRLRIGEL